LLLAATLQPLLPHSRGLGWDNAGGLTQERCTWVNKG